MNLIFHIVSAVAFLLLLYFLARIRAQRDFLRTVVRNSCEIGTKRLLIAEPVRYLEQFAAAWGIECVADGHSPVGPCRIDPKPLLELFLRQQLILISCRGGAVELYVCRPSDETTTFCERLSQGLGGLAVTIKIAELAAGAASGGHKG